jgi:hypothetical protein
VRYLAERYVPAHLRRAIADDVNRVRAAGTDGVQLLQTLYVPDDEVCFHLFESESVELVEQASRAAGFEVQRVLRVVSLAEGERE